MRLEECSDEEEEGDTGSEDGGHHKDQIAKTVTAAEKDVTKDVKSSTMQPDQEVPNVLVRLVVGLKNISTDFKVLLFIF